MSDYRHDILGPNGLSTESGTFTMKSPLMGSGEGGGGEDVLTVINFTAERNSQTTYSLTCEKTLEELVSMYNEGKIIIARIKMMSTGEPTQYILTLLDYNEYSNGFTASRLMLSQNVLYGTAISFNTIEKAIYTTTKELQ